MTDLSQYNSTHCCRYCLCAGVVAHFDNCPRPRTTYPCSHAYLHYTDSEDNTRCGECDRRSKPR
jgi:hypothetical protein